MNNPGEKIGFSVHVHKLETEKLPAHITAPVNGSLDFIRDTVYAALKAENKALKCDISVILTSDKHIKELNLRYLERDAVTDILCFPYSAKPPFKCDMFISLETSFRHSREYGQSHRDEIIFLVIHGILHLLGWRDNKDALRQRMLRRQREILDTLK